MKTVLVAGATGLVGKELVNRLCADPHYEKILVLSRRKLACQNPKIQLILTDFDQLASISFNEAIAACFCCLGTTQKKSGQQGLVQVDFKYVLELGRLCEHQGIDKYLVVSSQMANSKSVSFYMRTKGQMEEAVSRLSVPAVWFLRPSLLIGKRDEFRWAETFGYYLYKALTPLMIGRFRKMRPIRGRQVAHAMIRLSEQQKTGRFFIESDELAAL